MKFTGSNCPHFDSELERRPTYRKMIEQGMKPGIACDEGAAAYFTNGKLEEVVSSRPTALAYRVFLESGKIIETEIKPRYLG